MPETTTTPAASDETAEGPTPTATEQLPEGGDTPARERPVRSFTDVGVDPVLAEALAAKGIHAPFPIQELTLPIATKGHDVIGQARTGTGKTLAFALALLGRVTPGGGTQALVIVPTRELCIQVAEEMQIGKVRGLRTIAVYGGVGYEEQEAAFRGGHEIVVGTPGRLLDHLNKRNLRLDGVTELVLDEADEMLDMGFLPDVERLIEACASDRHGMLFSATMPSEVVKLARRYLDHPTFMRADTEAHETAPNVEQHFFQVHRMDKPRVLARILQSPDRGGVYVFVRTKHMADRLVRELEDLSTPAIAIHGDLRQATREKNLDRFRDGSATVLVATEVAARGLDVENVTHVINYDCPDDEKMYLHRIGRTARAGNKGVAVTFAEFNEVDRLNVVRKKLGAVDNPVAAIFSTSEELNERFDLPAERPWDSHVAAAKAGTRTDRRADESDDRGRGRGGRDGGRGGRGGRDGGSGGGERRKGSSDGRPKSKRSSEGTGNDRDADRSRKDRDRGADERSGSRRDAPKRGRAERDEPTRDEPTRDEPTRDEPTRDRAERGQRDRAERRRNEPKRDDTERAEPKRDEPKRDDTDRAEGRTRTRTRTRTTDEARTDREAAPRRDREAREERPASQEGGGRTRARARGGARAPEARRDSTAGGDGDRGGRRRQDDDREASGRERDNRDRGGRERDNRSRDRGGRERNGRDRDRDGGGREGGGREGGRDARAERSGGESRGRDDRGGRGRGNREGGGREASSRGGRDSSRGGRGGGRGGRDLDPTVTPARRGEEARGEGDPQLARRVKVEHLP